MSESLLKRLWDAVKPPPAVPRRPQEQGVPAGPSWLQRFFHSIAPPPAVQPAEPGISAGEKLNRRRTLLIAAAVVGVGGAAWEAYAYISSAPSRAEKIFEDGMLLLGKGDFQGAELRFTRAVSIWPQLASGYLERGLARRDQAHVDAAMEDFEHAIALDPSMAPAHTELGLIYRERGDLTRALNEYSLAIQLVSNTDSLYQRGQLYESLGQHEQAVADYDAAIHEQTNAPYIYRARARSRDALGDHDGAEEDRAQAERIDPFHPF